MINYIKKWLGITKLEEENQNLKTTINGLKYKLDKAAVVIKTLENYIANENEVNIDFNERGPSRVIFIGHKKGNQPVVRSYLVNQDSFIGLLNEFEGRHCYFKLGVVDATKSFEAGIKECYAARTDYEVSYPESRHPRTLRRNAKFAGL